MERNSCPKIISNLNKKILNKLKSFRLGGSSGPPYIHVVGIYLKFDWGKKVQNIAILVTISVNAKDHLENIGQ